MILNPNRKRYRDALRIAVAMVTVLPFGNSPHAADSLGGALRRSLLAPALIVLTLGWGMAMGQLLGMALNSDPGAGWHLTTIESR